MAEDELREIFPELFHRPDGSIPYAGPGPEYMANTLDPIFLALLRREAEASTRLDRSGDGQTFSVE